MANVRGTPGCFASLRAGRIIRTTDSTDFTQRGHPLFTPGERATLTALPNFEDLWGYWTVETKYGSSHSLFENETHGMRGGIQLQRYTDTLFRNLSSGRASHFVDTVIEEDFMGPLEEAAGLDL